MKVIAFIVLFAGVGTHIFTSYVMVRPFSGIPDHSLWFSGQINDYDSRIDGQINEMMEAGTFARLRLTEKRKTDGEWAVDVYAYLLELSRMYGLLRAQGALVGSLVEEMLGYIQADDDVLPLDRKQYYVDRLKRVIELAERYSQRRDEIGSMLVRLSDLARAHSNGDPDALNVDLVVDQTLFTGDLYSGETFALLPDQNPVDFVREFQSFSGETAELYDEFVDDYNSALQRQNRGVTHVITMLLLFGALGTALLEITRRKGQESTGSGQS